MGLLFYSSIHQIFDSQSILAAFSPLVIGKSERASSKIHSSKRWGKVGGAALVEQFWRKNDHCFEKRKNSVVNYNNVKIT